jgi:hypothetical protein
MIWWVRGSVCKGYMVVNSMIGLFKELIFL